MKVKKMRKLVMGKIEGRTKKEYVSIKRKMIIDITFKLKAINRKEVPQVRGVSKEKELLE